MASSFPPPAAPSHVPRAVPGKFGKSANYNITADRMEKLTSATYWTDCNITGAEALLSKEGAPGATVSIARYQVPREQSEGRPGYDRVNPTFEDVVLSKKNTFSPVDVGAEFGPLYSIHWYRVSVHVPAIAVAPSRPVDIYLKWCTGSEGMVYSEEGVEIGGVTGEGRDFVPLFYGATPGEEGPFNTTIFIEAQASARMGDGSPTFIGPLRKDSMFKLEKAEVMLVDRTLRQLRTDMVLLHQFATTEGVADHIAEDAMVAGDRACNAFRCGEPESYAAALACTESFFAKHSVPFEGGKDPRDVIAAVGNCHIDLVWLWPWHCTRMKICRSWSSQMLLLNAPDRQRPYTFAASQPIQMHWLRQDHPCLFDRIKKQQNFVKLGATWTEMDGNLCSGESFCRQFLLGQKFLSEHFGQVSPIFWLPDTFGYCAQLPQIAHHHGCSFFLTQKLSWNLQNKPQHTSFWWNGLGPQERSLLVHMPPHDNYCCQASVKEVVVMAAQQKQNHDMGRASSQIMLYGEGDGGGGPFAAQISRAERLAGMTTTPMRLATDLTPEDIFRRLQAESKAKRRLVTVSGELYFEMHRGVAITHRRFKKAIAEMEDLLRVADAAAAAAEVAGVLLPRGPGSTHRDAAYTHPTRDLWNTWSDVLATQFHDSLPGTSIEEVYVDGHAVLDRAKELCMRLIRDAARFVVGDGDGDADVSIALNMAPVAISPRPRSAAEKVRDIDFELPGTSACSSSASSSSSSSSSVVLPAFSINTVRSNNSDSKSTSKKDAARCRTELDPSTGRIFVDTGCLKVVVEKDGSVSSVVRVEDLLRDGAAAAAGGGRRKTESVNFVFGAEAGFAGGAGEDRTTTICTEDSNRWFQWASVQDTPLFWDAWDVEQYSLAAPLPDPQVLSAAAPLPSDEDGPCVTVAATLKLPFGPEIHHTLIFTAGSADIRFAATIKDWSGSQAAKHKWLRLLFGCAVRSSRAHYGCAFGAVDRPTHYNTSFDLAQFETTMDRWVDFSQPHLGVSFVNNSAMRGVSVHNSTVGLSVLRAPKEPDPTADRGDHDISIVVRPHTSNGGYAGAHTVDLAAAMTPPTLLGDAAKLLLLHSADGSLSVTKSLQIAAITGDAASSSRVHLTAVKLPEGYERRQTSTVDLVVRFYETVGSSIAAGQLTLTLCAGSSTAGVAASAWITDGLEQPAVPPQQASVAQTLKQVVAGGADDNGGFAFELPALRGFEIMTVRVRLEKKQ